MINFRISFITNYLDTFAHVKYFDSVPIMLHDQKVTKFIRERLQLPKYVQSKIVLKKVSYKHHITNPPRNFVQGGL